MSIQARTAELTGVRRFQLSERSVGDPGPGEVQVRVAAVGVCGSDLHSYSEGAVGDSPCVYPMVLGHEPAGVVATTGPGVNGWSRFTATTASSASLVITTSAPTSAS